jgi:hypothetical protein
MRHNAGHSIKYIRFEILQIMSPPEDVKFSNVRGLYLRKYGTYQVVSIRAHVYGCRDHIIEA